MLLSTLNSWTHSRDKVMFSLKNRWSKLTRVVLFCPKHPEWLIVSILASLCCIQMQANRGFGDMTWFHFTCRAGIGITGARCVCLFREITAALTHLSTPLQAFNGLQLTKPGEGSCLLGTSVCHGSHVFMSGGNPIQTLSGDNYL